MELYSKPSVEFRLKQPPVKNHGMLHAREEFYFTTMTPSAVDYLEQQAKELMRLVKQWKKGQK